MCRKDGNGTHIYIERPFRLFIANRVKDKLKNSRRTADKAVENTYNSKIDKALIWEWLALGKRLLVVLAGTGGAGKSFIARLIAQWLLGECKSRGIKLDLHDADESTKRDFQRFFPGAAKLVDIASRHDLVNFMEALLIPGSDSRITLVDFRGDQQSAIRGTETISPKTVEMLAARHNTHVIVVVPVVAGKPSSAAVLPDWARLFGHSAHYIVVFNERDGAIQEDALNEEARKMITDFHATTIRLPGLHPDLARELERLNCTMGEVAHLGEREYSESMIKDYGILANVFNVGPVAEVQETFIKQLPEAFSRVLDLKTEGV